MSTTEQKTQGVGIGLVIVIRYAGFIAAWRPDNSNNSVTSKLFIFTYQVVDRRPGTRQSGSH
jgi:hypothetical protein